MKTSPPIERENIYYGEDIAVVAIYEIGRFLQLLAGNEFVPVKIDEITVGVEVTAERLRARLTRLDLPKKEFSPGEEFTATGVLLPFRGEEVKIPLEITIPEDFPRRMDNFRPRQQLQDDRGGRRGRSRGDTGDGRWRWVGEIWKPLLPWKNW